MKYSTVIIAKNEADRIGDCIRSAEASAEIIVVDDVSTDNTAAIAASLGARVLTRKLEDFASQKNFGIDAASNLWVLILDADERLSPELSEELGNLKDGSEVDSYSIPFRNHVGGYWLRYGGLYPDHHVRLFRKDLVRYADRGVHEVPTESTKGVAQLAGDIIHYTYRDFRDYRNKVAKYSAWEAREDHRLGIKRTRHPVIAFSRAFVKRLVVLRGYRDGRRGLISAALLGYYQWNYARISRKLS
jgi:glycosyltransferase involved in cell wall biosynthesis